MLLAPAQRITQPLQCDRPAPFQLARTIRGSDQRIKTSVLGDLWAIANTTWVELGKTVEKFGLVGRSLSANKQRVRLAG